MNSSCFIICELNWIVFMAILKHFRVKMRLASFCCANLMKYKYTFCLVSLLFSLTSNGVESHCNANNVLVHLSSYSASLIFSFFLETLTLFGLDIGATEPEGVFRKEDETVVLIFLRLFHTFILIAV